MSNLRIVENRLTHVEGEEALGKCLARYTNDASISPDTPVVIITATLFERLKFKALCNSCA